MSTNESVEVHLKIPKIIWDEVNQRAKLRKVARTQVIEESLREHLQRIRSLETTLGVKERELAEAKATLHPSKDMLVSLIEELLEPNTPIALGWEYERIARFFLSTLKRTGQIYIPIEAWHRIKEALPASRRAPLSQLTDYEQLCRILYPSNPLYFERCLLENKDIYLVKAP